MVSLQNENKRKNLGEKLKKARLEIGLTQAEVAKKTGIHVNYYARVERGEENPTFDMINKIFDVLKVKSLP